LAVTGQKMHKEHQAAVRYFTVLLYNTCVGHPLIIGKVQLTGRN